MNQSREVIAGIAHQAREVYGRSRAAFEDAVWPSIHNYDGMDAESYSKQELAESTFTSGLEELTVLIAAGLEALGAPDAAKRFVRQLDSRKKQGLLAVETPPGDYDGFWSPLLWKCCDHLAVLEAAAGEELLLPVISHELALLERILMSTSMILDRTGLAPCKEKEVYDAVARHLDVAFPTFTRHITFHTPMKRYCPEFGVGGLRAVVEYKLAKNSDDVAKRIDELAADVCGYKPNGEWKRFFAVIHNLGAWCTQERVDRQVKRLRFPKEWKVIVTHQSSRLQKNPRSPREGLVTGTESARTKALRGER